MYQLLHYTCTELVPFDLLWILKTMLLKEQTFIQEQALKNYLGLKKLQTQVWSSCPNNCKPKYLIDKIYKQA